MSFTLSWTWFYTINFIWGICCLHILFKDVFMCSVINNNIFNNNTNKNNSNEIPKTLQRHVIRGELQSQRREITDRCHRNVAWSRANFPSNVTRSWETFYRNATSSLASYPSNVTRSRASCPRDILTFEVVIFHHCKGLPAVDIDCERPASWGHK